MTGLKTLTETKALTIRLTADEYVKVDTLARQNNLSKNDAVRLLMKNPSPVTNIQNNFYGDTLVKFD